jgi:hypothetical protein
MIERIKQFIRDLRSRDFTDRFAVIVLGVLAVIIACGGGALFIYLLSQRVNNLTTAIPSPISEPTPTLFLQAFEAQPNTATPTSTATPTVAPTLAPIVVQEKTNTPTRSIGAPCIYSDAWINNIATPIPDGGFSAYEGYLCDNGYWVIGIGDWVDQAGNWGKDGSMEKALIKFNGEGIIIDRIFFDLHGNKIPGPEK